MFKNYLRGNTLRTPCNASHKWQSPSEPNSIQATLSCAVWRDPKVTLWLCPALCGTQLRATCTPVSHRSSAALSPDQFIIHEFCASEDIGRTVNVTLLTNTSHILRAVLERLAFLIHLSPECLKAKAYSVFREMTKLFFCSHQHFMDIHKTILMDSLHSW